MGLVLTRRRGEVLVIRHRDHEEVMRIKVDRIQHGRVRLYMEGDDYDVVREELLSGEPNGVDFDGHEERGGQGVLDCGHRRGEDHMNCVLCGKCREDLDRADICSDCRDLDTLPDDVAEGLSSEHDGG